MVLSLTLLFPLILLALPLLMERVERPLRIQGTTEDVVRALASAGPEELEHLAAQGYAPAVARYRRRRRFGLLRPERSSLRG